MCVSLRGCAGANCVHLVDFFCCLLPSSHIVELSRSQLDASNLKTQLLVTRFSRCCTLSVDLTSAPLTTLSVVALEFDPRTTDRSIAECYNTVASLNTEGFGRRVSESNHDALVLCF